jgi:hypothetical protein
MLSNFRCSNNTNGACADAGDCNFGTCIDPPGICSGNYDIPCSGSGTPCTGTCSEVSSSTLPLALERGGIYTGGGLNSVPLPFPVPDKGVNIHNVSGSSTLTLSASTPAEVGDRRCTKGRTCSNNPAQHCVVDADCGEGTCLDNCLFGPPLPIPNTETPATSVCTVNVVDINSSGTVECDGGDTDMTTPLRSVVYLNGDLFKGSTPPDIPGVQPCPLCDRLCVGGTKAEFPCDADGDCPGSTCDTQTRCLGGPDDGAACTPETSDSAALGDPENSFPTSHDCGNDPEQNMTRNFGGLPFNFHLISGTQILDAVDRPNMARVFCGYCRDVEGAGSGCFEGDTAPGCPSPGGGESKNGVANPCNSDTDCADGDEYESCVQRNPGAFSEAASTRISVTGSTDGGCLADGQPHAADLVSIFCMPPTFNATVDAATDLPGPGANMLQGEVQLQ